MTRPLSPKAQEIWDAYEMVDCDEFLIDPRQAGLAAALRAAADQVASPIPDDCSADVFNRQLKIRKELLALATELETD